MRKRRLMAQTAAIVLGLVGWAQVASAALITQGYATTQTIAQGSLVSIDTTKAGNVVASTINNQAQLFGVVVPSSSGLLSLSGGSGEVQVATSGTAVVLVSTEGGSIHRGDHLGVSTVSGVAKKADANTKTIGTADADFDDNTSGTTKQTVQTTTGTHQVSVGEIQVDVSVGTYLPASTSLLSPLVPSWLTQTTAAIAGKPVSPVRALVAAAILIASLISISVLLYGAVRTSILSIGRNPLARSAVFRGLLQVTFIVFLILGIAVGISYVVIK